MKKFFISIVLLATSSMGFAQQEKMAEPEYIGQVAIVNADSTTTLMQLEKTTVKAKSNGLGFVPVAGMFLSKGMSFLVVPGTHGTVVLSKDKVKFIVRVDNHDEDPSQKIGIIKLETKKKERRFLMASGGIFSGVSAETNYNNVKYDAKKIGKSSFLISVGEIEPGEYAIITKDLARVATFSVE